MTTRTTRPNSDRCRCCDCVLPAERTDILCGPCWQECARAAHARTEIEAGDECN
jgi:hypothetical protein